MTEKLKQKMNGEIAKLPKEKQEAINSFDWGKETEKIGKKFSLTDNEINNLQLETGLFLLGFFSLDLFTLNIENEVGLTGDVAKKIADEILNKVFTPVSEKIMSSIKDSVRINNVSWDKTVDFIVSGGDYSVFVEK